jgi:hypothetical protein
MVGVAAVASRAVSTQSDALAERAILLAVASNAEQHGLLCVFSFLKPSLNHGKLSLTFSLSSLILL